jgi:hypothetical protein
MSLNNQNPELFPLSGSQPLADLSQGLMETTDSSYGLTQSVTSSRSGSSYQDIATVQATYQPTRNYTIEGLLDLKAPYDIIAGGSLIDNAGSDYRGDLSNPFDDIKLYAGESLRFNQIPAFVNAPETITVGKDTILGNHAENYRNSSTSRTNLRAPISLIRTGLRMPCSRKVALKICKSLTMA